MSRIEAEPTAPHTQAKDYFPFARPPIRPKHLIPVLGMIIYGKELEPFKSRVPADEWNEVSKGADRVTLHVAKWPTPKTPEERRKHLKTQAVHGLLMGYHSTTGALLAGGITLGTITELSKLLS